MINGNPDLVFFLHYSNVEWLPSLPPIEEGRYLHGEKNNWCWQFSGQNSFIFSCWYWNKQQKCKGDGVTHNVSNTEAWSEASRLEVLRCSFPSKHHRKAVKSKRSPSQEQPGWVGTDWSFPLETRVHVLFATESDQEVSIKTNASSSPASPDMDTPSTFSWTCTWTNWCFTCCLVPQTNTRTRKISNAN